MVTTRFHPHASLTNWKPSAAHLLFIWSSEPSWGEFMLRHKSDIHQVVLQLSQFSYLSWTFVACDRSNIWRGCGQCENQISLRRCITNTRGGQKELTWLMIWQTSTWTFFQSHWLLPDATVPNPTPQVALSCKFDSFRWSNPQLHDRYKDSGISGLGSASLR